MLDPKLSIFLASAILTLLIAVAGLLTRDDTRSSRLGRIFIHIFAGAMLAAATALFFNIVTRTATRGSAWTLFGVTLSWILSMYILVVPRWMERTVNTSRQLAVDPIDSMANSITGDSGEVTMATRRPSRSANSILRDFERGLIDSITHSTVNGKAVTGWHQFLGSGAPSGIGSAYGLSSLLLLDCRDPRVNRALIYNSILDKERPDGGWAAHSQGGDRGHAEVTAWVAPPLYRLTSDPGTRTYLVTALEEALAQPDPIGEITTTVAASSLSAISQLAPQSLAVDRLMQRIFRGAQDVETPVGMARAWGAQLDSSSPPDAARTARVVIALLRARQYGHREQNAGTIEATATWLSAQTGKLDPFMETIRRDDAPHIDHLSVGHFTSAWVARALMLSGQPSDSPALRDCIADVISRENDGSWVWPIDGKRPIWMAYQGAASILSFCRASGPWPTR